MIKRTRESFIKRQKEIKRKQKAQEKRERRQSKNKPAPVESVGEEEPVRYPVDAES